jgi:hypothetical protein
MSNTSISNIEWDLPIVSHFNKTATRVNDVKGEHRKDDRGAVEHINVCLIHDDLSLPFIRKFVCPINGADEHPDSCHLCHLSRDQLGSQKRHPVSVTRPQSCCAQQGFRRGEITL